MAGADARADQAWPLPALPEPTDVVLLLDAQP